MPQRRSIRFLKFNTESIQNGEDFAYLIRIFRKYNLLKSLQRNVNYSKLFFMFSANISWFTRIYFILLTFFLRLLCTQANKLLSYY